MRSSKVSGRVFAEGVSARVSIEHGRATIRGATTAATATRGEAEFRNVIDIFFFFFFFFSPKQRSLVKDNKYHARIYASIRHLFNTC